MNWSPGQITLISSKSISGGRAESRWSTTRSKLIVEVTWGNIQATQELERINISSCRKNEDLQQGKRATLCNEF